MQEKMLKISKKILCNLGLQQQMSNGFYIKILIQNIEVDPECNRKKK